jgi:glycerol-3-phosphate dehydrogenase (NAD+)
LLLSCGVADVIATCYGGRNRLCSQEFTRRYLLRSAALSPDDTSPYEHSDHEESLVNELWNEIEKDLLHGQKLEGVAACKEAITLLEKSGYLKENPSHFPLFRSIYRICVYGESYYVLFNWEYY